MLLPQLSRVHNVFHVLMLKYVLDLLHVLRSEQIDIQEDLTYEEQPVQTLESKE